jgi:predicted transcriptional regulator
MIIVGLVGYFGLTNALNVMELSGKTNELSRNISNTQSSLGRYLFSIICGDEDLRDSSVKEIALYLDEAERMINELKVRSVTRSDDIEEYDKTTFHIKGFKQAFDRYRTLDVEKAKSEVAIDQIFQMLLDSISDISVDEMTIAASASKASVANYLKKPTGESWSAMASDIANLEKAIESWRLMVEVIEHLNARGVEINKQFENVKEFSERLHSINMTQDELRKIMRDHDEELDKICAGFTNRAKVRIVSTTRTSSSSSLG